MQTPTALENIAESLRVLEERYDAAAQDGRFTGMEKALIKNHIAHTRRQARIALAMQTLGIRLIRTTRVDKNRITELRAIDRDNAQSESRLLEFPTAAQRKQRSGNDPDAA